MEIGIVNLGISNVKSVKNMLLKAGSESVISGDGRELSRCKKLILPGIGSFDPGIKKIHNSGLWNFLKEFALNPEKEILGICLGMQLMTKGSEEGTMEGLGLIDASTIKFKIPSDRKDLKIPNMGWRESLPAKDHYLLGSNKNWRFYFVHSYYVQNHISDDILMTSHHGIEFTSAFARNNIYGMQFHPEKSHHFGLKIFHNFLEKDL